MRKIRAEIHLGNIRRNAQAFKKLTGTRLCAVVKADAYGHGAEEVVNALEGVADCFAVSLLSEATAIRLAACGKDILILSPPLCESEVRLAAKDGFILTVPDLWTAKLIVGVCERDNLTVRVHCKTNTGMNRYGMNASMLGKACKLLRGDGRVRVEGLYSHLYGATRESAEQQRKLFAQMQRVCKRYFPDVICHLSATYGSLLGKEFALDMTRVGIGLYGYLPDGAEDIDENAVRLEKGMQVYAEVATSRKYSFGGAGYGKEFSGGKRLSVLRVGYADGFLRKKENGVCGYGENANNLCMDACVRVGAKRRGQELLVLSDAAETARVAQTISYEVLCAATRRAERLYDDI